MMAAALGPPEVIAQLENAAKVLMVRMPDPESRGIRRTPPGSTVSGSLSAHLAAGDGLGMDPEVEVVVAWRRILHPTFFLPCSFTFWCRPLPWAYSSARHWDVVV